MKYEYKVLKFQTEISFSSVPVNIDIENMNIEISKYAKEGWKVIKVEVILSGGSTRQLIVFMERVISD